MINIDKFIQDLENLEPDPQQPTLQEISEIVKEVRFEEARKDMQIAFREAGIESREQILDLIQDVKKELFGERIRNHQAFLNGYAPEDEGLYDG